MHACIGSMPLSRHCFSLACRCLLVVIGPHMVCHKAYALIMGKSIQVVVASGDLEATLDQVAAAHPARPLTITHGVTLHQCLVCAYQMLTLYPSHPLTPFSLHHDKKCSNRDILSARYRFDDSSDRFLYHLLLWDIFLPFL